MNRFAFEPLQQSDAPFGKPSIVAPICNSLMVTWKPRTATSLDQSSKPYASPSWTDTAGRLSTTEVTPLMLDCCIIIGSATVLRAKMRGSSAMTLTVSSNRAICMMIGTVAAESAPTATGRSTVSKPGRIAETQ